MAYLGMADPDLYREAIRSSVTWWTSAVATLGAQTVATDLRPTGGSISDTSRPGVRRAATVELADPDGSLYEKLAPAGTRLTVTTHVRYTDRTVVDIPMGVYVVDRQKVSEGEGTLSLTAPDKWSLIQRARFIGPAASTPGLTVTQQIVNLIQGALGVTETVVVTATSEALVGALTWEKDRDKAILDLAKGIGAWVYFDRNGIATVADLPTVARQTADWQVDAGGVLTSLDRERSRDKTYNVVVVSSSAAEDEAFPTQYVWDEVHNSPTYAGPDPVNSPEKAGPFGIVPYFFDTPLPLSSSEAMTAGYTTLARVTGLASTMSASQAPNPAVDAFDSIDVLPPGWRTVLTAAGGGFGSMPFGSGSFGERSRPTYGRVSTRVKERHFVDTVTHPLVVGPDQQIDGRTTAVDFLGELD